jgi:glycosyltransferase involved in cell wall biosynthesis/GT2 family glycosyltransferase
MPSVSVVVPVKDGERWLAGLIAAVRSQPQDVELLVIDSGSRDRSRQIALDGGAELIEIDPAEFGHGRTRNLGAERTSSELICFLTQDAEPVEGWLAAYLEAFGLDDRVGAAYGPHRPRPGTSPMIARELEEFFASFAPNGHPALQSAGDPAFLSNVNACYRRDCWEEIRFDDIPYSEDQAFGRALLEAGWKKVYHPGAAVLHAHDYGTVEFMRRYFDEYRGLRDSAGHVEPLPGRAAAREVRGAVAGDLRWMRERGTPKPERARWAVRSLAHHSGRRAFAALGSRADRLPAGVQRGLSLEGRAGGAGQPTGDTPAGVPIAPGGGDTPYVDVLRVSRDGPAPLLEPVAGMADRERLHIAVIIPAFERGSGGHSTIFTLLAGLEAAGHTCSVWLHDPEEWLGNTPPAVLRHRVVTEFAAVRAPVLHGFDQWHGADVVVATGWETVHPALLRESCRARAYLVQDHEPDFFPRSAKQLWAEETYSMGLYAICAGSWLRDLLARRYGTQGGWFRLGVDHSTYRPLPVERRRDTVVFYARPTTPRRAVPLGLLALEELRRRRPDVRIVTFGHKKALRTSIGYEALGVAPPSELARTYSESTVGLCLSLTNYSLIPQEMMACGLPCVDLRGGSSEAEFGSAGPVELAEPNPVALADAMEAVLDDESLWQRRSEAGLEFVRDADWDHAARQVEQGLREALRQREAVAAL